MSIPVYRLAQVFGSVASNHKVRQGHEYERIGRVQELAVSANLARGKVLNNMGRFYDVVVKRATKGQEQWQRTGFVAACSCPDPNALCKHITATVFALGRRLEADAEVFEVWMGVSAEIDLSLQELSADSLRSWWDSSNGADTGDDFDVERSGRPDELLRRLGPPPRNLGLSDLPDLLAPAYSKIADAGRKLFEDPASAIKASTSTRR
jgi:uncharacterized Zn finger protein